jgi:ornithine carbamoyltransferase
MHTHTSASTPATPSSPSDADAILARARELAQAAGAGLIPPFLRGMNLGLIRGAEDTEESRLFERAATALGARVTPVVMDISELGAAEEDRLRKTARMLGRLYDGLECEGLAPALVQQLRRTAGVPVFDGLASQGHATVALADRLAGAASMETKRLLILQGALIFALLNHYPARGSDSPIETPASRSDNCS